MEILNSQRARASRYASKRIDLLDTLQKQLISDYQQHYDPTTQCFDYRTFSSSEGFQVLKLMLSGLEQFDLEQIEGDENKRSFWLNIYNLLCIHLVTELEINDSVRNHRGFFSKYGYRINGLDFSLDDIEHGILRANHKAYSKIQKPFASSDPRLPLACATLDPRIHFGLYSASAASPALNYYEAEQLDHQLTVATLKYLQLNFRFEAGSAKLTLPKMFKWYGPDFGSDANLINFILTHISSEKLRSLITSQRQDLDIHFSEFDWSLNQYQLQPHSLQPHMP